MEIPAIFRQPIILDNKNLRKENPSIAAHFAACEAELHEFLKDCGGGGVIRDPDIVEWINCPCCGQAKTKQWLIKNGGRYDICYDCNHVFLKNMFRKEVLHKLYKESVADALDREVNSHAFNRRYWAAVYDKYIQLLSYLVIENSGGYSLLDVGCGAGFFLEVCNRHNIDCEGVDVFNGVKESLQSIISKDRLHQIDDILSFSAPRVFDVVTMWGVLEHLPDTQRIFHKCCEILDDDGILLSLIPNFESRAIRYLGATIPTLNPREHVNFYSPKSIENSALKAGLTLEGIYSELPIIDLMWPFIDENDDTIIDDIVVNNESYYLVYIFRKKSS